MVFVYKLLFVGFGLGATGIGLGIEKSVGFSNSGFGNKSKIVERFVSLRERECRIHKLMTAKDSGKFERVEKEDLRREIERKGKGDYESIEKGCLENVGKDIFVSNQGDRGWRYLKDGPWLHGEPSKFQEYLKRQNLS
ncbi:hypothetical protein MHC_01805 [Mycoplasma haemocanis str. Illinois]|uniref:Uncharacterized protein n=1 Tax=Mycoplasma haemocanis (strain Illinois) TaxID=1111676 RepID=H6N6F5_MYCHN|nr:hypothetical protein [Mycoplasma haemocanis]AEW45227.1 hypothetical protein MHC_01805 [Mycoplasma haemocanis str. Illinois]